MHRVSLASSCSSPRRGRLSKVKKTTAVLKLAMTGKRERWQGREWYGRPKSRWQQPTGCDGGQSSHDTWDISQSKGSGDKSPQKWTQWNKNCEENAKRETELHKWFEVAVMDEKQEERERGMIRDPKWRAPKEKGRRGRSKKLGRRNATQPRRSPE